MPKTWIVRQQGVTLLLLCVLLSLYSLKKSNFFFGQILKAFLALFLHFFCSKKFSSIEASRHYWKLKKQNKRDWNSAWDDQSIPCLATDGVCGEPGAVWVGWGPSLCYVLAKGCSSAGHPAAGCGEPFPESSSSRGCSASLPLYTALHDPQSPSENQKYPNTMCLWGFYARVSCQEGQHSFTEPGRALQPNPSPAIAAAGPALGWVVVTCTAAGQGGWPSQAGSKKK